MGSKKMRKHLSELNVGKSHYKVRDWFKIHKKEWLIKQRMGCLNHRKGKIVKCFICRKERYENKYDIEHKKRFFCSRACYSKSGMNGGNKNAVETCRKMKKGFFDSNLQSILGKRGAEVNRKNKTNSYFDIKIHRTNGLKAVRKNRLNKPYWFLHAPFDSKQEKTIFRELMLFGLIPEESINCHIELGGKEIDGLLWDFLFFEYHPWDRKGLKRYYNKRRKLLDKNGHSDNPLWLIKSMSQLNDFKEKIYG